MGCEVRTPRSLYLSWASDFKAPLIPSCSSLGHLMERADSLEKTLVLGMIEGKRRRELQKMRWLGSINNSVDMNLSKTLGDSEEQGCLVSYSPCSCKELDMT